MMQITIQNQQKKIKIPKRRIQKWIEILFLKKWGHEKPALELSLMFVTDAAIKKLNRRYRGKNKPTDVLAFPGHPEARSAEGSLRLCQGDPSLRSASLRMTAFLGDIVISVETAKRNAKKFGKTLMEEVKFLVVHGFLHLLGYDHEISRPEEIRMQKKEKEYMKLLEGH